MVQIAVQFGPDTVEPIDHVRIATVETGECDAIIHGPEHVLAALEKSAQFRFMLEDLGFRFVDAGDVPEDTS